MLSTYEVVYVAAIACVCHGVWLKNFVKSIHINDEEPAKIFVDNQSAIDLEKNPVHHERTKHIDTRFHFIREKVASKEFVLEHVKMDDQLANIFTKPLKHDTFNMLKNELAMMKEELGLRRNNVGS